MFGINFRRLLYSQWSLKQAVIWIVVFKLLFVVCLKMGLLGKEQTKGIEMQLPLQQVQENVLGPTTSVATAVTTQK